MCLLFHVFFFVISKFESLNTIFLQLFCLQLGLETNIYARKKNNIEINQSMINRRKHFLFPKASEKKIAAATTTITNVANGVSNRTLNKYVFRFTYHKSAVNTLLKNLSLVLNVFSTCDETEKKNTDDGVNLYERVYDFRIWNAFTRTQVACFSLFKASKNRID